MKKSVLFVSLTAFLAVLTLTIQHRRLLQAQEILSQVSSPISSPNSVTPCANGLAGIYPCEHMNLLAFMTLADLGITSTAEAANVWGWTDPTTNKEYALVGLTNGTAFVDISDPVNPVYLGRLPTHIAGQTSAYRDLKVYQDYAFIIGDTPSNNGLQVFDLTELRDIPTPPVTFSETAHYDGFVNGHNISINADTGFAYVVRTPECNGAVFMLDIHDPLNITSPGCYDDGGAASDSMCVVYHGDDAAYQGHEICVVESDNDIVVGDVTTKTAPIHLATLTYSDVSRAHHGWFTPDHNYYVSADMHDELDSGLNTRIFIWDFRSITQLPTEPMAVYTGPTTGGDHNIWINGNRAYVGNFRAGFRMLDTSDIAEGKLTQVAYFDNFPEDNNPTHGGAWAVYPYFASGVIAVSDKEQGLFLLRPAFEQLYLPLVRHGLNDNGR